MQKPWEGEGWIDRRKFLKWWLGALAATVLWVPSAVAQTLDRTQGLPQHFLDAIERFEAQDSHEFWNMEKYTSLVEPMIQEGLDTNNNLAKLRYLIYRELKKWYSDGVNNRFRWYNAEKVWDDNAFFGNIGSRKDRDYVYAPPSIVTDERIEGNIGMTPEAILSVVPDRLEEHETGNIAFILKDANGIYIFVYYEEGRLKYIFPTTPGSATLGSTPDNLQVTDRRQLANYFLDDEIKRMSETERQRYTWKLGGSMPYSRRLDHLTANGWEYDGHNTHVGDVIRRAASHGCARQGILWAYLLFYGMKSGTLIYYRPQLQLAKS